MDIKRIIINEQIKAKKQYGQNFLINKNILTKIVDCSNIENKNVIEVGPGLGSLTEYLLQKAKKVVCYEIDSDMVKILNSNFNNTNLTILQSDFLKVDLKQDINDYFDNEEVTLVANLPYYITTAILTKVLEESKKVGKIVVMVQKEVAKRLAGKPSTKDYNSLSVLIQYYMEAHILFNVSPKSFIPEPAVDSSVILLERKKQTLPLTNEAFFLKFNRAIFVQRRKTIYNNLKSSFGYNKEMIESILIKHNLSLNVRAEELTVEQIVSLSNDFSLID
ncbi:MAG: 16S rRNA (adenine(1518)-N(6)/adenine(1519)-N(6))-dimethyltransferase RsmA [Bacilli bacterium]|nr:16S rRNA (adenine(1518)-N(6)/adenine(1519)-N(6))-dimethyltransferase RsmA [Bacilli bacterium]MDD7315152.1 16S rRNA (adenine(1518)-N(6)/adenine(1519)-N(6))-dimethyltransferase RsmA [Bacilli bacterium]MDY4052688.1 16S rRNA (adenine(1518)-N(6)/adenine(1519)-N(6))-dimethyltransferase RsmA [Bacilli bacterium]